MLEHSARTSALKHVKMMHGKYIEVVARARNTLRDRQGKNGNFVSSIA
jgi:hypothetical protein